MAKKRRSDADRRVRQAERLGRLLRILHLIMGRGRWDADALAEELECSRRTVYRLLQTLSMAGVPWYFDEATRAYRVRPGFRFPGIEQSSQRDADDETLSTELDQITEKLISDGEAFAVTLQKFLDTLRESRQRDDR
jgi:predicted ArsR family transcriptional regulator